MLCGRVHAIYTAPDPAALKDRRVQNLIEYARKVESDMYESANTRVSVVLRFITTTGVKLPSY